ncbi:hypothetical protein D3C71_1312580 [compost metagenome]
MANAPSTSSVVVTASAAMPGSTAAFFALKRSSDAFNDVFAKLRMLAGPKVDPGPLTPPTTSITSAFKVKLPVRLAVAAGAMREAVCLSPI